MNCKANKSIECTVHNCAYHCDEANYCSLDKILVGNKLLLLQNVQPRKKDVCLRSRSLVM